MLQEVGLTMGQAPERWNLENPDAIRELARSYATAGSDLIYTNTFGGNRIRADRYGLAAEVREINRAAVRLAREGIEQAGAAGCRVGASVGPTGELVEPYGDLTREAARDAFSEQIAILVEAGVDALVCESFIDLDEALLCVEAARAASNIPIVASLSFEKHVRTVMGVTPEAAVAALSDAGASVVGANCSIGPEVVEQVLQAMHGAKPDVLLLGKPNAGLPELVEGKPVFPLSPEDMKSFATRMLELGAAIIGGCCGTTPGHIAAMAAVLNSSRN